METPLDEVSINARETTKGNTNPWSGVIKISLDSTTQQLKERIFAESGIPVHLQKLLCIGKFLKDDVTLQQQGVKANTKLLVMRTVTEDDQQKMETDVKEATKVDRLKRTALEIARREDSGYNDRPRFEIHNQNGELVRLSPSDEEGLKVGMTLHEKGKVFMKKGDFKSAAELFQEAEKGFVSCSDQIIRAIDNYGLLCLDLVWCYFQMKEMTYLKDAESRLQSAHECLERVHGKNFDRLLRLKGVVGPDLILWCRLHLLEGIVAYHNSRPASAKIKLAQAEEILSMLKVKEEDMNQLMAMGFAERESRLALRAHPKSLDLATEFLFKRQEEQRQQREKERQRKIERREQKKYGKSASGFWVNLQVLQTLCEMGFSRPLAAEALKQTDNNQDASVSLLTNSPHLLQIKETPKADEYDSEIQQILAMGFTRELALGTLQLTHGDVERAVELLLNGDGVEAFPEEVMDTGEPEKETKKDQPTEPLNEEEVQKREEKRRKKEEEERQRQEDEEELLADFPSNDSEDYLDVLLDEEESVLNHYKSLVESFNV